LVEKGLGRDQEAVKMLATAVLLMPNVK